jgi:hypothetical protein
MRQPKGRGRKDARAVARRTQNVAARKRLLRDALRSATALVAVLDALIGSCPPA